CAADDDAKEVVAAGELFRVDPGRERSVCEANKRLPVVAARSRRLVLDPGDLLRIADLGAEVDLALQLGTGVVQLDRPFRLHRRLCSFYTDADGSARG